MSDYKDNHLVVQSNQFVRKSYNNLKANEIKMFDIFVSCIDTIKPKTKITITKAELLAAMGDNGTNYTITKATLNDLMSRYFVYEDDKKVMARHLINSYDWDKENELITVEFHKDILGLLIDLKKNFLSYSFHDLKPLKSRYSMLMYKYVLSYIRQYKTNEFTLELEEIKKFLNLKDKYKDYKGFKRRVLEVVEKEINNARYLPYLITYEQIKRNKRVVAIKFKIRPRTTNKETYFNDLQNPIIYEEMNNELIKGDVPIEEIRQRQADALIKKRSSKKTIKK